MPLPFGNVPLPDIIVEPEEECCAMQLTPKSQVTQPVTLRKGLALYPGQDSVAFVPNAHPGCVNSDRYSL